MNVNSAKFKDIENIIFEPNYKNEEEKQNEMLNNNILNFFIIHDFYYIISNDNDNNIEKDLFINNFPLKFEELIINSNIFFVILILI